MNRLLFLGISVFLECYKCIGWLFLNYVYVWILWDLLRYICSCSWVCMVVFLVVFKINVLKFKKKKKRNKKSVNLIIFFFGRIWIFEFVVIVNINY